MPATVFGVSAARRWVLLATMLLGTTLAVLDSSILNLSVVPVMEEFRADLATEEWVLTSYNLTFAAFMIGFGSLGDATGRRRLYVLGQVISVRTVRNHVEGAVWLDFGVGRSPEQGGTACCTSSSPRSRWRG